MPGFLNHCQIVPGAFSEAAHLHIPLPLPQWIRMQPYFNKAVKLKLPK
jgi:hypothetical protein